jgi:hypothetical protein
MILIKKKLKSFDWRIPFIDGFGILNRNKEINPAFQNYSTIFVTYCDGTS